MEERDGDTGARSPGEAPGVMVPPDSSGNPVNAEAERGGIVTAKGTGDGLVIRMDGRVDAVSLKAALNDFVVSRRSFLAGNEVTFEWIGCRPEEPVVEGLAAALKEGFGIVVKASVLRERKVRVVRDQVKDASLPGEGRLSLFGGVENLTGEDDLFVGAQALDEERELERLTRRADQPLAQASAWDDADARLICGTLRSGQRVETEHSLIIVGDVNSGGEIIAGGDIVVLGTLRGVAHAGAYDETGGGRFIFALALQPTQLRIGAIISRGGADVRKGAEIARVDDNVIVVEPYQARTALGNLRRL